MGSNLWDLEFSAATDDLLAIARLLAAAGGRLWGWFALAAIIIGGIWGGVFGTAGGPAGTGAGFLRSEEHTSELQSLMRISYAVFCLKKKKKKHDITQTDSSIR